MDHFEQEIAEEAEYGRKYELSTPLLPPVHSLPLPRIRMSFGELYR
jgi:hypothetical protein